MPRWVGAQGQVTSAKRTQKHAPLLRHPQETPNPNLKMFFNRNWKTCRIRRWFEHLSSSITWRVMAEIVSDYISSSAVPLKIFAVFCYAKGF